VNISTVNKADLVNKGWLVRTGIVAYTNRPHGGGGFSDEMAEIFKADDGLEFE
jgi:hypothetical protein